MVSGHSRFRHLLFLLAALICSAGVAKAQITPAEEAPGKKRDRQPEPKLKSTGSVPREEFLKPKKQPEKDSINRTKPQNGDSSRIKSGKDLVVINLGGSDSSRTNSTDSFFSKTDKEAVFPGGDSAFNRFVTDNFSYPERCREEGIEGYCMLLLGINAEGLVKQIKILEYTPACPEFSQEVVKLFSQPHLWIPATINGKTVASWRRLPFRLNQN